MILFSHVQDLSAECDSSCPTFELSSKTCSTFDATGSFFEDNTRHNNSVLAAKCSFFATDGGCHICQNWFIMHGVVRSVRKEERDVHLRRFVVGMQ